MSIRLSLCMATYNRSAWIGETLDTIVPQLNEIVELVVVDGASPDATESVVRPYAERHANVTYVREKTNSGVDADYDKAVGYARGEYCWLIADDDLLTANAVARVLEALADHPDLVIVDAEVRTRDMRGLLDERRLAFSGERTYGPEEGDALLADTGDALSFIGGVVIRRELWMERDRASYFGTAFIHVGVIFQHPIGSVRVVGEPLVQIRMGNAMWTPRSFDIWMFRWPDLIWGMAGLSDAAKSRVTAREPWRSFRRLLLFRASGALNQQNYRSHFAARKVGLARLKMLAALAIPGPVAHIMTLLILAARKQARGSGAYNLVVTSPHSNRVSRAIARRAAPALSFDKP